MRVWFSLYHNFSTILDCSFWSKPFVFPFKVEKVRFFKAKFLLVVKPKETFKKWDSKLMRFVCFGGFWGLLTLAEEKNIMRLEFLLYFISFRNPNSHNVFKCLKNVHWNCCHLRFSELVESFATGNKKRVSVSLDCLYHFDRRVRLWLYHFPVAIRVEGFPGIIFQTHKLMRTRDFKRYVKIGGTLVWLVALSDSEYD